MLTGYYQKNKESPSKKIRERCQYLFEERKTKSANRLVSDEEIFLKKKSSRG